ncbi:MAG: CPBP family intramembrane metalloprotease [Candidatus Krumholzibacteria bacterium]|nr:CPBP family intramembrane metalloprotease [Candidatus Krumholzibacteria bacterium]
MDEKPRSNTEVGRADVFTAVNNYLLLIFCGSCVLSSMYIQQLFLAVGQYRSGIGVSALVGIMLPLGLVARRFGGGLRRQLCVQRPRLARSVYVVLATLAVVVVVDQIYLINQQFMPVPEDYLRSVSELKPEGAWAFAVTFVGLCLLVPAAEEMVFRGFVQRIFARNMGGVLAFVLAGIVFGAVHLNPHLLVSIGFFGIYLGFVFYASGNLSYTVMAHAVFNTIALLQLTFTDVLEASEPPFYLQDVRMFVVAVVLLVYLLVRIKRGGPETEPPRDAGAP